MFRRLWDVLNKYKSELVVSSSTVGQWSAGPSSNQGVGGSIPALVDVSLSKTLNPEVLPVSVSTVFDCNRIVSRFGQKCQLHVM